MIDHDDTDWRSRALAAESQLDEAHLAYAALVAERDEIESFAGRAVNRSVEHLAGLRRRDAAIDALTRRAAELLAEVKTLREFSAKFRHAEIESLT